MVRNVTTGARRQSSTSRHRLRQIITPGRFSRVMKPTQLQHCNWVSSVSILELENLQKNIAMKSVDTVTAKSETVATKDSVPSATYNYIRTSVLFHRSKGSVHVSPIYCQDFYSITKYCIITKSIIELPCCAAIPGCRCDVGNQNREWWHGGATQARDAGGTITKVPPSATTTCHRLLHRSPSHNKTQTRDQLLDRRHSGKSLQRFKADYQSRPPHHIGQGPLRHWVTIMKYINQLPVRIYPSMGHRLF